MLGIVRYVGFALPIVAAAGSGVGFMLIDFIVSSALYANIIPICEASVVAAFDINLDAMFIDIERAGGAGVEIAELLEGEFCRAAADEFASRIADNELQARLGATLGRFL